MQRQEVERDGRRVAVWTDAAATVHAPLVALHGGPGFTHAYLTAAFAAEFGRPSVYFDWPGCGDSSRHPGSGYPLADYIADLEAVRTAVRAERMVLAAHAWGAIPAIEYAIAHPGRCAGLVLVNPLRVLTGAGQDHEALLRRVAAVDPAVTRDFMTEVAPLIERALGGDASAWARIDASPWWARMWKTQFMRPPPATWSNAVAQPGWGLESYYAHKGQAMAVPDGPLASYDLAQRAAGLACPTLIIASDSDANYVSPLRAHAAPLHAVMAGSTLEVLPDTGHFPFVECPQAYRSLVAGFLPRVAHESPEHRPA